MTPQKKRKLAQGRRDRVRQAVVGTAVRPRMAAKFSGQHIYVQFVDDAARKTLAAVGSRDKDVTIPKRGANVANAEIIGKLAAAKAIGNGICEVIFDRGSARYHGKVKTLAEAARAGGLKF